MMNITSEIKETSQRKGKNTTVSIPIELADEIKNKYGHWINLSAFVQTVLKEKLSQESKEASN